MVKQSQNATNVSFDTLSQGKPFFATFALETYPSKTIPDKSIMEFIAILIEVCETFNAFVLWHILRNAAASKHILPCIRLIHR
jgi:hypothetical protein